MLSKLLPKKWQGIWIKRKEVWQPRSQIKAEHSSLLLLQMKHSLAHAASQRVNHEGAQRWPNQTHIEYWELLYGLLEYTLCVRVHSSRTFELAAVKHFLHVAVQLKQSQMTNNKQAQMLLRLQRRGVVSSLLRNNQYFFLIVSLEPLRF